MILVVDGALLLSVLGGGATGEIREALDRGQLFTTGSWYYRLARAAHDWTLAGALSSAIDVLTSDGQARVAEALDALPQQIGLLDMRRLVPIMRRLPGRRLNFLTAEAIAAALALDAAIRVTTDSRLLHDACQAVAVDVGVVSASSRGCRGARRRGQSRRQSSSASPPFALPASCS